MDDDHSMVSHEELAEIPVVVATTSEAEGDRFESYRNQISAYIVKPRSFDSFPVLLDVISPAIKNQARGDRRGGTQYVTGGRC